MDGIFDDFIKKQIDAETDFVERVVEQSVQSGEYGVKIVRSRLGFLISCQVDPEVPYGQIHSFVEEK